MRHKAIAIIGGSGFIGSHLVNALVEMGKTCASPHGGVTTPRHLTLLPIDVIETDVLRSSPTRALSSRTQTA